MTTSLPGQPRSRTWRTVKNRVFIGVCAATTGLTVLVLAYLLISIFTDGITRLDGANRECLAGRAVSVSIGRQRFVNVPFEAISKVDEILSIATPTGIVEVSSKSLGAESEGPRTATLPDGSTLEFARADVRGRTPVYQVDPERLSYSDELWTVSSQGSEFQIARSAARASSNGRFTGLDVRSVEREFGESEITTRVPATRLRPAPSAEPNAWIAKGESALASIDITPAEAQPMTSGFERISRYTQLFSFLDGYASRNPLEAGFKAALWGSIWLCVVAAVFAIPLGVATAVALEEYKPKNKVLGTLHEFIKLNITNLAGVPSIVYGILGLTVFVRFMGVAGSPNLSSYDEMLRVAQRGEAVVQGDLKEETPDAVVLTNPATGRDVTIPTDTISSRRIVYVREHIFKTTDGREIRGTISAMGDGRVQVVESQKPGAAPAAMHDLTADQIRSYSSKNMISFGKPDGLTYFRIPFGGSVLAGGMTLALVILPIIIVASREAIRAVPDSLREGAFAVGCTRWQMVARMILPASVPGIMTGSILAMSRAIGEAAPLLVVGGFLFIMFTPRNLMDDFAAMPLQIFNWAQRPQDDFHAVAASGILVLLGVLLMFNALAIVIRQKFQKPLQ